MRKDFVKIMDLNHYYNMADQRFPLRERPLEPPDVNDADPMEQPACQCVKCRQDVWRGEHTFDGMCKECFTEHLVERVQINLKEVAEQLGYDVLLR